MTLAASSEVTRELSTTYRHRPLMVTVNARFAIMREKGRRDRVTVPWDAVYECGLKLRARQEAREKKQQRGRSAR